MAKTAIVTDSNSGITQQEAKALGIFVLPMPFEIDGQAYFEDINLTQPQFYEKLLTDAEVFTSQPAPGNVMDLWNEILQSYDEIVHIPMSSGLSNSCETAILLAEDYHGRVQVVNNQRISVTMRQSVLDAMAMVKAGRSAAEIRQILEDQRFDSGIYIMVDTLKYLKKGGRVTPAAAALGTLLRLKPVLQIKGEKLDAFAKARTVKQAKSIMINQVRKDLDARSDIAPGDANVHIAMAYTPGGDIDSFYEEVRAAFPDHDIVVNPLSLSVSCHIGPGAIAVTWTRYTDY